MSHVPVLFQETIDAAKEIPARDGVFVDGTFGRGGHTRAIMEVRSDFHMMGVDCDQAAVEFAKNAFASEIQNGKFEIVHKNFDEIKELTSGKKVCGFLLDLGVSSPQLDEGPRGFSFYTDGPLDMRMDQSRGETAADIVNEWDEDSLVELFQKLGEVDRPRKVVGAILRERNSRKFSRTSELSTLIEKTDGWRKKGHHPATNYFLALRLQVNRELERVQTALPIMAEALVDGGRLLVITFHSLEDRIVKNLFREFEERGLGVRVNKKVIEPSRAEVLKNPRARSAKLRVWQKGEALELLSNNEKKRRSGYIKER